MSDFHAQRDDERAYDATHCVYCGLEARAEESGNRDAPTALD
jgi:hypothetical protein